MVEAIAAKAAQSERLLSFIRTVQARAGILTEFDEQLWSSMVDFVKVHETGRVYDADLEDISQRQEQLWDGVQKILAQLSKLS